MSTEKTKKELQEELIALKAENEKIEDLKRQIEVLKEEKRYLAEAVDAKNAEIANVNKASNDSANEKDKNYNDLKKEFDALKEEYQKLYQFADRRTKELEEVLTLFNQNEALIINTLDLVKKNKEFLLEKINK